MIYTILDTSVGSLTKYVAEQRVMQDSSHRIFCSLLKQRHKTSEKWAAMTELLPPKLKGNT